jgi:hypothetical protein
MSNDDVADFEPGDTVTCVYKNGDVKTYTYVRNLHGGTDDGVCECVLFLNGIEHRGWRIFRSALQCYFHPSNVDALALTEHSVLRVER